MKGLISSIMVFSFLAPGALAQSQKTSRNTILSGGIVQIKDDANYGLVFSGPEFKYGMAWNFPGESKVITYEYEIGVQVLFSREIPAPGFYLKPFDLAYMFVIPLKQNKLFIGPAVKLEYRYNLYPDLQSGFDYWFTDFGTGLNTLYSFNLENSQLHLKLNSIFLGIASRQPDYRNPYYYDLGFTHAVKHLNQDFRLGSLSMFNTSTFELLWASINGSGVAIGYVMNYSGFYNDPEINLIHHNIKVVFNKKNEK